MRPPIWRQGSGLKAAYGGHGHAGPLNALTPPSIRDFLTISPDRSFGLMSVAKIPLPGFRSQCMSPGCMPTLFRPEMSELSIVVIDEERQRPGREVEVQPELIEVH